MFPAVELHLGLTNVEDREDVEEKLSTQDVGLLLSCRLDATVTIDTIRSLQVQRILAECCATDDDAERGRRGITIDIVDPVGERGWRVVSVVVCLCNVCWNCNL